MSAANPVAELIAVLVAVSEDEPRVLTVEGAAALPAGPFVSSDRSLQASLRAWVEKQTHHPLGYVEQLYTFADADRVDQARGRMISISYLALTREAPMPAGEATWRSWYRFFPWEDARAGAATAALAGIVPSLRAWADSDPSAAMRAQRRRRIAVTFGLGQNAWNEDLVLQRYELMFEAKLAPEAGCPSDPHSDPHGDGLGGDVVGLPMHHDHRRILATAIARLRAKIKYRPLVFELMPDSFTLWQLQRVFEAVAGRLLHKQNFRRLVAQQDLVEETGEVTTETGGRPAKLVCFRKALLAERAVVGTKLPLARSR